ncbi:MAG TPA: F0F1 ATP synthase subunit A [Actinomycetota bacterium]|nr:F0F1 ATP synthase subunit A [Actinomycetota bacterium]
MRALAGILAFDPPPEGFHAPGTEIFETPCVIGSGDMCFNRVSMLIVLAGLIVIALVLVAFRKPALVPRGLQNAMESIVEFIRNGIALEVMGPSGLPWVPFLTTLFLFIFVNNIFGILPFINFPTTSRMAIPAFLAILVYIMFIVAGVRAHGLRYFKDSVVLPGVPAALHLLLVPIEFVSTFIVRPLTLSVRLAANMIAGHLILTLFFIGATYLAWKPSTLPFAIPAFGLAVFLVAFEVLVAVLQAYIFTILAAVYIGSSIHSEH